MCTYTPKLENRGPDEDQFRCSLLDALFEVLESPLFDTSGAKARREEYIKELLTTLSSQEEAETGPILSKASAKRILRECSAFVEH